MYPPPVTKTWGSINLRPVHTDDITLAVNYSTVLPWTHPHSGQLFHPSDQRSRRSHFFRHPRSYAPRSGSR